MAVLSLPTNETCRWPLSILRVCLPPIAPVASEVGDVPSGQQCLDPLEQHLLCGYLVALRWGEERERGGGGEGGREGREEG